MSDMRKIKCTSYACVDGRVEGMGAGFDCGVCDGTGYVDAASPAPQSGEPVAGWVVGNGDGTSFRAWGEFGPEWVDDRAAALRFARREDAESFCRDDEDAWTIQAINEAPLVEIEEAVATAMLDAWNDICGDGAHPDDIEHGRGKYLTFKPKHWARSTARLLAARLAAPPSPVGEIVKWCREKAAEHHRIAAEDATIRKTHLALSSAYITVADAIEA